MGNLLTYSGLSAKIHAMQKFFLTDMDFRRMTILPSVADAVLFLSEHPSYGRIFGPVSSSDLHRGQIERLLYDSLYRDYDRLYLFSGPEPRRFLKLYFSHFEVRFLKQCLRSIINSRRPSPETVRTGDFFRKYSQLPAEAVSQCRTLEELTEALRGTVYHRILSPLLAVPHPTLFDYETALDLWYFSNIWRRKNKLFEGEGRKILTEAFGARLDLLNLQWIYRSRKYFGLRKEQIYSLLIPVHYRVPDRLFRQLLEADSEEQFLRLVSATGYAKKFAAQNLAPESLEEMYRVLLKKICRSQSRRLPYSIAGLNAYLFLKEEEIHDIVTVVEGIRYRLPPAEIYSCIR